MFTTIWSKVFAHQRALVSVLSFPLANRTLPPLCTSYWPRELKICLSVGQSSLKQTPKIDNLAQYYSDRIFSMRAKTAEKSSREKKRNFQSVDVDSMDALNVRSLGPEYVGHMMWKELNIDKVLSKKGVPKNLIPIAEALILGRLIHPKSERGTREWVENTSSLTLSSAGILRHVRSMPITVPLICSTDARMLWRNIGRLIEKYPRPARLYHIEVEPGEKDKRT